MIRFLIILFLAISIQVSAQEFSWVKQFGGLARDAISSSAVDPLGNNYHIGYFGQSITFENSSVVLTTLGKTDIFFTKFDRNGVLIWAKQIGGTDDQDCRGLFMLDDGTLLLLGRFKGTIDVDMGNDEHLLTDTGTGYNAFLANYDGDGNLIWVNHFTGDGDNTPDEMKLDADGSIFLSGRFKGSIDFDPDPVVTYTRTSGSVLNSYLIKLDSSGIFKWGKHFNGNKGTLASDFCIYEGYIYFAGQFQGNMSIDPENTPLQVALGVNDLFLSKFGTDGTLDTLIAYGTERNDEFFSVTAGASGLFLSGTFIDEIDIDPDPNAEQILISNGSVDAFVLALDHDLRFKWAKHFGGSSFDLSTSIQFGLDNNTLFYMLKYNNTVIIDVSGVQHELLASSTTATDVAILTMNPADGAVSSIYEIKGAGEEYPLLFDFDNGDLLLSGAFEASPDFDNTPGGNHFLSSKGITDCFIMRFRLGLNTATYEIPTSHQLPLFPVPVSGGETLNIELSNLNGTVQIFDSFGRLAYKVQLHLNQISIPPDLPSSIYYLIASDDDGIQHIGKFIVR